MATIENYAQVIEQKVKLMLDSAKSNEGCDKSSLINQNFVLNYNQDGRK
jgi:hypothetical protein